MNDSVYRGRGDRRSMSAEAVCDYKVKQFVFKAQIVLFYIKKRALRGK